MASAADRARYPQLLRANRELPVDDELHYAAASLGMDADATRRLRHSMVAMVIERQAAFTM